MRRADQTQRDRQKPTPSESTATRGGYGDAPVWPVAPLKVAVSHHFLPAAELRGAKTRITGPWDRVGRIPPTLLNGLREQGQCAHGWPMHAHVPAACDTAVLLAGRGLARSSRMHGAARLAQTTAKPACDGKQAASWGN